MNVKRHYELNPNSPFFDLMQDTSVEDQLSEEEKERAAWIMKSNLLSADLETSPTSEDEKNYLLYSTLNDISPKEAARNILIHKLGKEQADKLEIGVK